MTLSSDSFSSTLLQSNSSHLKNFDYNGIIEEAKECTLLLHRLLTQCLKIPTSRTNTNAVLSTIICILAKPCRNNMSLVLSLVRYAGHCSKMVLHFNLLVVLLHLLFLGIRATK